MASEQLQIVVNMLRSANPIQGSLLEMRANMERGAEVTPLPGDVKLEKVNAGGVPAEWSIAPGAREDRALVWLHGGGYCLGSIATHRALCARLSRLARLPVLNVDYRLAPEHPHPAAVEDAVAALRFAYAQGFAPARVALGGDSAGGGLTLATLLALRELGEALPAAAVLISPWTDLSGSGESVVTKAAVDPMVSEGALRLMAEAYLAGQPPDGALASPLFSDLRGLPPLLVQVGSAEILLDDSLRLASRAREAGVDVTLEVWEDMIHVWHAFADILPEGMHATQRIGAWLEPRLAPPNDADALAAIEEIKQLKARYFRLIDTQRWDEIGAVFTRDAQLVDEQSSTRWQGRDEIVAGLARALDGARTVHQGHTPEIELLGENEARGIWAMSDWVDTPAFTLDGWGHYHERYVFEEGAWRIADERISRLRVEVRPKAAARKTARRAPKRSAKKKAARAAKPAPRRAAKPRRKKR